MAESGKIAVASGQSGKASVFRKINALLGTKTAIFLLSVTKD